MRHEARTRDENIHPFQAADTPCEPLYASGEPTTLLPLLRAATNRTRWAARLMRGCVLWLGMTLSPAQAGTPPQDCDALQRQYAAAVHEIERLRHDLESTQQALAAVQTQRPGNSAGASASEVFQTGNAHFQARQYAEAVAAFTQAIALAPQEARLYKHRGMAYVQLGQAAPARQDLTTAIAMDPSDAVTYNQRGIAAYALGDLQQALRDFTQASELQPQLAEAYNNRGIVQRQTGDYRQAVQDVERAAHLGLDLATAQLQVLRDEIRQAQERLRLAGIPLKAADGVPGQQTTVALRHYQRTHGLPVTGLLDEATRNALGVSSALPAPRAPTEPPPRFVHQPTPEYPSLARQNGWEGTVTLRLALRADGTVDDVQVARSSGHAVLDTAAQEAAKTWTHVPVTQNGSPVTRWVEVHLAFRLDKTPASAAGQ